MKRVKICFVCTGNICRSPLAEAVLRDELERRGVADQFEIDSAGTDAYHVGEPADPRMRQVAARNGVNIVNRARRISSYEVPDWDYIFALDEGHKRRLNRMAQNGNVLLFREFDPERGDRDYPDVPDPWYGGPEGFENVFEIVSRTCRKIADHLEQDL